MDSSNSNPEKTNTKMVEANKVGGRRVPATNHKSSNADALREVLDSGLPAKMDHAYPTEAVKHTHDKPAPTNQLPHVHRASTGGKQRFIPQKQNH